MSQTPSNTNGKKLKKVASDSHNMMVQSSTNFNHIRNS